MFFDGEHNILNEFDMNICESEVAMEECRASLMKSSHHKSLVISWVGGA